MTRGGETRTVRIEHSCAARVPQRNEQILTVHPEIRRPDADDAAEDLGESTRAGVADFERDLDQAALGLKARPLLCSRYGDRDFVREPFADVVFHLVELADGQAAADLGFFAVGVGVFLDQVTGKEPGEIGDAAGIAAGARGQRVGAGLAEVGEGFAAPEEVDLTSTRSVWLGQAAASAPQKTSTARWIWMTSTSCPAGEVQRTS